MVPFRRSSKATKSVPSCKFDCHDIKALFAPNTLSPKCHNKSVHVLADKSLRLVPFSGRNSN